MHTASRAQASARQGLVFILVSALLWGTVGISTKALYCLTPTTPLSIGFFRLALAVPALGVACLLTLGQEMFRVARRDLAAMVLIGAMTALYQVCYFAAIRNIGVAAATLVTLCIAPVVVAVVSSALTRKLPSARIMLALVCALAGAVMLVGFTSVAGQAGNTSLGIMQACGSAFSYAMVTLVSRSLAERYHPLQSIAIGFTAGAMVLLPFAMTTGFVASYPVSGWVLLTYLGVVPTALAYVLFLTGMRTTSATAASICTLLEPLVSTLLAWLVFGERFGRLGIAGAALLLAAIALLAAGSRRQ